MRRAVLVAHQYVRTGRPFPVSLGADFLADCGRCSFSVDLLLPSDKVGNAAGSGFADGRIRFTYGRKLYRLSLFTLVGRALILRVVVLIERELGVEVE